jgi:DNA modification methylase
MPESVTDRPTRSHEFIFLLSKSSRYYYNADAIREPLAESSIQRINQATFDQQTGGPKDYGPDSNRSMRKTLENFRDKTAQTPHAGGRRQAPEPGEPNAFHPLGANKRDVWTVATAPYPGAHFATFPRELITPCILAGCPPGGLVLDPFMGSGTVAEVALGNGRHYVGYEINAEYHALIQDRLGLFGAA